MSLNHYIAAGCLSVALVGCSGTSDVVARSEFYVSQQNYYQAYWIIEDALAENPADPTLERVFWERRLDYLLDRGRELLFLEREEVAIQEFHKALALDPHNPTALYWIQRAKEKLAKSAFRVGDRQRHEGDLDAALKSFNRATTFVPEYPDAVAGIDKVNGRYKRLADKANQHYILGKRADGEQQNQQAHYHGRIAQENDESHKRAQILRKTAARRLAAERLLRGEEMEEKGFYSAALKQYKEVQAVLPDQPGLAERIALVTKEVEVRNLCKQAGMLVRRNEFDRADELLASAFGLSQSEKARVSGLMLDTKRRRYEEDFKKAKDLELELQFEAALEAYTAIDKAWKQGFLDVKTRISGLTSAIEVATQAWKKGLEAEKKNDLKTAIDQYEEAVLVYPGFMALDKKLKELRARQ